MTLKEFYERIIENKVKLEDFLSLLLILAAKENKLTELITTIPELEKVLSKIKDSNVLKNYNGVTLLNLDVFNSSKYYRMLNSKVEKPMDTTKLFYEIGILWRGKIGVGKNGGKYVLYDKVNTEKNLIEFIQENSDISFEVIIEANKEFLNGLVYDKNGAYMYTPKCSTFIKGNESSSYLIEFCYNIINKKSEETNKITVNNSSDAYSRDL